MYSACPGKDQSILVYVDFNFTKGGSQLFETAEKGGVMKNGPLKGGGSCKYVSVII